LNSQASETRKKTLKVVHPLPTKKKKGHKEGSTDPRPISNTTRRKIQKKPQKMTQEAATQAETAPKPLPTTHAHNPREAKKTMSSNPVEKNLT
jgi:hypothetical protein